MTILSGASCFMDRLKTEWATSSRCFLSVESLSRIRVVESIVLSEISSSFIRSRNAFNCRSKESPISFWTLGFDIDPVWDFITTTERNSIKNCCSTCDHAATTRPRSARYDSVKPFMKLELSGLKFFTLPDRYAWSIKTPNVEVRGGALLRRPSRLSGWALAQPIRVLQPRHSFGQIGKANHL